MYRNRTTDPLQVERHLQALEDQRARANQNVPFLSRRLCASCGAANTVLGSSSHGTIWSRCSASHDTYKRIGDR